MRMPQLVRRVIAARHVERHEDWLVQDYLRLLRKDSEKLREELEGMKPVGFSPGGRYVFGRLVAGVLLVVFLVAGGVWWRYSGTGAAFREGFREGAAAGSGR